MTSLQFRDFFIITVETLRATSLQQSFVVWENGIRPYHEKIGNKVKRFWDKNKKSPSVFTGGLSSKKRRHLLSR
ncbi:MAG: hypothetical protein J6X43_00170, partial [Bacteroidales bacterium]|nr:hypothetical protein [Bacteroidales bacterium]